MRKHLGQKLGKDGCMHSLYRGEHLKQRYGKGKPEVAVSVRPGVYKIPMVRMFGKRTDEPRMYRSIRMRNQKGSVTVMQWSVRTSKNLCYENPYCVTGAGKLTGLERTPKGTVLCSLPLLCTLYHMKTEISAASVFIPICAGAAPAW